MMALHFHTEMAIEFGSFVIIELRKGTWVEGVGLGSVECK